MKSGASTSSGSSLALTIAKAFSTDVEWVDKDELLDIVYWGKQVLALMVGIVFGMIPLSGIFAIGARASEVLALMVGIVFGMIPLSGIFAIGLYIAVSTFSFQQFVVRFHNVDEDEVGGFWELAKEGFGAAFATFMVSWITVYSSLHAESR